MDSVHSKDKIVKKPRKILGVSELAQSVEEQVKDSVSYDAYRQLEVQLEKANAEIEQLKVLLAKVDVAGLALPVSDEEEIASIQLNRIKMLSRERALTLEESKILEVMVKTKRQAKGDATEIISTKDLPKNLDKSQLIQIAAVKNNAKD